MITNVINSFGDEISQLRSGTHDTDDGAVCIWLRAKAGV